MGRQWTRALAAAALGLLLASGELPREPGRLAEAGAVQAPFALLIAVACGSQLAGLH